MKFLLQFAFVMSLSSGFSQTKTAHLNYNKLILLMPETKKADTTLNELTKNYQAELTRMENEYKVKSEKFPDYLQRIGI